MRYVTQAEAHHTEIFGGVDIDAIHFKRGAVRASVKSPIPTAYPAPVDCVCDEPRGERPSAAAPGVAAKPRKAVPPPGDLRRFVKALTPAVRPAICEYCGDEFKAKHKSQWFCTPKHAQQAAYYKVKPVVTPKRPPAPEVPKLDPLTAWPTAKTARQRIEELREQRALEAL